MEVESTQSKGIGLSELIGWLTGLLLGSAAIGKILAAEDFSVPTTWAIVEPLVSFAAIRYNTKTWLRVLMCLVFSCFIVYLLVFLDRGLDCKCFGFLRGVPTNVVLSLDIVMLISWGALPFWDSLRITTSRSSILKLLAAYSVLTLLSILSAQSLIEIRQQRLTQHDAHSIFDADQREFLNSSDAAFFIRSHCSSCVTKLARFEEYCQRSGIRGVVVVANDAIEIEDIRQVQLPLMHVDSSEYAFGRLPYAVLLENGNVTAELQLH